MKCTNEKAVTYQDYKSLDSDPWIVRKPVFSSVSKRNPGVKNSFLQFGYEAEFQPEELSKWTAFYEPLNDLIAADEWAALGTAAQTDWLRRQIRSMGHGNLSAIAKRKNVAPSFLPEFLHRDDTGNVELIMGPIDFLSEFHEKAGFVEANLGIGSLQAMVSIPSEEFFSSATAVEEHQGWLSFFSELDILERLHRGHDRAVRDPQAEVVRSFFHPFLGPMIEMRHRLLRKFLRENSQGRMLDEENLIRPRRREHSFKFVGTTAYRPDVAAPDRICFEVRDAHKNPELLRNRIARILFFWQRNLSLFSVFSIIPAFDSAAAFAEMDEDIQVWLMQVAPFKGPEFVREFDKPRFAYEVFRNFSYPLRDWMPWAEVLSFDELAIEKLRRAQQSYVQKLRNLLGKSGKDARVGLQQALAEFSVESDLFLHFRIREDEMIRSLCE